MDSDDTTIGDEPLADGMAISVRYRRDFTVTDAARLLTVARAMHVALHPGATAQDAAEDVTSAADAIFTILERAGVLGDEVDARLAALAADGLQLGGWRAQVIVDEPDPLRPGNDCLRPDAYALPRYDAT